MAALRAVIGGPSPSSPWAASAIGSAMASTQDILIDTLRHRQKEAIRHGKIDINRVKGEIAKAGGDNSREFITICQSIEATGEGMVDDWLERCVDAAERSLNKLQIRKSAHDLVESFIVEAKTWRRIPAAFHGHLTQNKLMDDELDRVRERLGARFDDGQNRLALKPTKKWHERNPVRWAILLGVFLAAITALFAYVNFAAQTATKSIYEPKTTTSAPPRALEPRSSPS